MNIKRKIICLIIVFSFLFSMSAFSSDLTATLSSSDYGRECYNFLKAVEIIKTDEVYNADLDITRGHFVKLSLGLAVLDTDLLSAPSANVFDDVPLTHEYASEIESAYRLEVIAGSSDNKFEPDLPITLSQSVKIICGILGYSHMAEALGGYPYGYMSLAVKYGLLDGLNTEDDSTMKMSDIMCLLKNAAQADVMIVSSLGDTIEYISYADCTVLSERRGINAVDGIVCDDGITNLKATESEIPADCICIGQTVLKDAENYASKYLGYSVRVYYDTRSGGGYCPVLYVWPDEENIVSQCNKMNTFTVENSVAEFETDDEIYEKIKISNEASYIFNGKMKSMSYDKLSEIEKGSLLFISNDGDKVADVVIVLSYETNVISGVSVASGILSYEDGTFIEFDEDDESFISEIIKDDSVISLSEVKPGNVILAAISKGEGINKKRILVSDAAFTGMVTSVSDNIIAVDSKEYFADLQIISKIKPGNIYSFKLDALGNIASVDSEASAIYGYLFGLKIENLGNVVCKIYTENDRWVQLDFDSKITFNGESKTEEEAYYALGSTPDLYRGLIRYRVNSAGEVKFIETPGNIGATSSGVQEATKNNVFRISYEGSLKWRSSPNCFDSIVWVKPSTVIFSVPTDGNESDIKLITSSKLQSDRSYSIKVYDMDENMNAGVVVINEKITSGISYGSNFMIVKSKVTALDYDGEPAPALRGWWNGNEFSFTINTQDNALMTKYNSINKGDVILFGFGNKDEIISINRYVFKENGYYDVTSPYDVFKVAGGIADKVDYNNGHAGVVYNSDGDYFRFVYSASTVVYVYDVLNDQFAQGDIYDIFEGDRIIVKMRYLSANEVVVFKD